MRRQPDGPACEECGFGWGLDRQDAIDLVAQGPAAAAAALRGLPEPTRRAGPRWSASMYVWHLVDVLRIGTERLLTLTFDPERGIPCWDENALAADRRYQLLSPVVGPIVLRSAAREWVQAAQATPMTAEASHPEFGVLTALDIIRRAAHEVRHHLQDIGASSAC
jgi:hypothetical protein